MRYRKIRLTKIDATEMPPADPSLMASVVKYGLNQPLLVMEMPGGRFRLLEGSRRLAAVKSLGWETVACQVAPHGEYGTVPPCQCAACSSGCHGVSGTRTF